MPRKKKLRPPVPTVTLGEALGLTATDFPSATSTITHVASRHLICPECRHEVRLTILPGAKISCPKCTELFFHKHIPQMEEIPPPAAPPAPPAPKPKLKGLKRYAKVIHEPINPKFCFIRFEDDNSEGRLWKDAPGSLRFQQLIVEPNRDEGQGGWTIVRDTPHL